MPSLMSLRCPTCGAQLQVAAELNGFGCKHCGNRYLLGQTVGELNPAEREQVRPNVTYTHKSEQWLHVGEYEVRLHRIVEEKVDERRVLYVDVAYRNNSTDSLTCRHDQWVLFDREGYTYDPIRDFDDPQLYGAFDRRYHGLSRIITPGMKLRGWLAYVIPASAFIDYLQFSGGSPAKSVEYRVPVG